jgi:hypothetical protein
MNPVIYYRVKKPVRSLEPLPKIDLSEFFDKDEGENSQIAFTISKAHINLREVRQMEISDQATIDKLDKLMNISKDEDEQILAAIDKEIDEKHANTSVENISHRNILIDKNMFRANSSLQEMDLDIISLRKELLIKFNKAFSSMLSYIDISQRNIVGTASNVHYRQRHSVLSSIINKMIDSRLHTISMYDSVPEITVNRRRAFVFSDVGNVDHEGRYSIYGQIVQ